MSKLQFTETKESMLEIGASIRAWRILLGLKAQQVGDRARVSISTYNQLENGRGNISLSGLLSVLRTLGLSNKVVEAVDPLNSDLGQAKLSDTLPRRVKTNE